MDVCDVIFNNSKIIKVTTGAEQPIGGSFAPWLTKITNFQNLIK